jgi:hypothetical protein
MIAIIVVTNNIAFYGSYQQINAFFSSQLCHYSQHPCPLCDGEDQAKAQRYNGVY